MNDSESINSRSITLATICHVVLVVGVMFIANIPSCRENVIIPMDMTVVLNENLDEDPEDDKPLPMPEPPKPIARPLPPPPPLPTPVKAPDAVVQEEKKTKPKPKKPDVKKEEPKKVEPKKSTPKPEPKKPVFKKGQRVQRQPEKITKKTPPKEDFTKLKRVGAQTDKKLSDEEIAKMLNAGAREGTTNQLPKDEENRCAGIIKKTMYTYWDQPPYEDNLKPTTLDITFDTTGRIINATISSSSGNPSVDQTVLDAAKRAPRISNLSLAFLKKHRVVSIVFEIE